ncbi:tetraacyldisaccharide 4'-kinase [Chitinophagaceae bacterium IBVUCB1]|nr:tetraacyldisaccharide 4'-kinase [Chitinophagaceae bacterium IBVUCB1]
MKPFFSFVKIFLYPFALIYGAVVWLRNRLYDTGFFSSVQFSVPVITVGNLSVGGTGKTPHVEYLIRLLQYRYRLATMSRGYNRRTQGFLLATEDTNALRIGDEPMQYFMKFPDLAVSVAEERITGIPTLIQKRPDTEIVLLDDAYQHRSVKAGRNILITDFSKPFYKDHILPMGTLREGRKAYERADIIIVSKCPVDLDKSAADTIIQHINPQLHQQVYFTTIQYGLPYDMFTRDVVSMKGKNALIVCGIAKPEPFVQYIGSHTNDTHILSYADHHYFLNRDIEEIKEAYNNWGVNDKFIITTEKDATRLHLHADKLKDWGVQIAVLPIQVSFLFNGYIAFDNAINSYIESEISGENDGLIYEEIL